MQELEKTPPDQVSPQVGTPAELVVAERSMIREMLKPLLFGFLIVLLIGGGALAAFSLQQSGELDSAMELASNAESVADVDTVDSSPQQATHSTAQTIFKIPVDVQWEDQEISYDVQTAYIINNQLDAIIPDFPEEELLLVFEVQVSDNRSFGEKRIVPVRNYINTRHQSKDFAPLGQDQRSIVPGESVLLYVPFSVPKTESQVRGLLGDLRNPYVIELDMESGDQLFGRFDLQNGYQTQAELQSAPETATSASTPSSVQQLP